jgi:isochorismate pyruvate lyase
LIPKLDEIANENPMPECNTMDDVRRNIDRLDHAIVSLIAERATYVRKAAQLKMSREQIVDRARIEEVIARVRARAQETDLDADLAEQTYRRLIELFIKYEEHEFSRFHAA